MSRLTSLCQEIYYGLTPKALRARYTLVVFDLFIISYFVVTTFMRPYDWIIVVDLTIGALLVVDFFARMIAHSDRGGVPRQTDEPHRSRRHSVTVYSGASR